MGTVKWKKKKGESEIKLCVLNWHLCFIGKLRYLPGYQCSDTENDLGMLSSPPAHKIQHTLHSPGKRLSKNRPNDIWITISILSKFQQ